MVSSHREENIDYESNFSNLIETLNSLSDKYDFPIIFSTHPRTLKKIEDYGFKNLAGNIKILKPLGFFDYNFLQINAFWILIFNTVKDVIKTSLT